MPSEYNSGILIIGAGFSGAVIARQLAEHTSYNITVIDKRDHIGGNCHTVRDSETNVMVHRYGPHIFNTNHTDVWDYVRKFADFEPFTNRVKINTSTGIYSFPINLHTINQFFSKRLNPEEAKEFIYSKQLKLNSAASNLEEQALSLIGRELYETFFEGYTTKQWGCHPRELPGSILQRIPIRFNYNDNYYSTTFQGIPKHGYTALIENLLAHPRIEIRLNTEFRPFSKEKWQHIFYSGPIDEFFDWRFGRLSYRTVHFERFSQSGDIQGTAVINYPDQSVKFTRIHEHKHFAPWETHASSVAFREYSRATEHQDTPFYPLRLSSDLALYEKYKQLAQGIKNVTFVGRLGTYRYLDMDQVIGEALDISSKYILGENGALTSLRKK